MSSGPVNSDPPVRERVYYRHSQTSDRGWLVLRDGKQAIRFDRGAVDQWTHNVKDWNLEHVETAKYNDMQIAQVAFEADKKLCWALGLTDLANREWSKMPEELRVKWLKAGPPATALERVGLYKAIKEELSKQ